jgi:N-methylhydantoinase A/oxoprolinase/acetone carboxylase beta subunit
MSAAQSPILEAFIGVDVGGTHTDVSVVAGDRVLVDTHVRV